MRQQLIYGSQLNAGFLTVLVGFTSSVILVFQAGQALNVSSAELGSWLFALCLGMGGLGIILSWHYKEPIVLAWSTSGAVVIIGSSEGIVVAEAIGAFMISGVLIAISGWSGGFHYLNRCIHPSIASAILAGILFSFCLNAFLAILQDAFLVLSMLLVYFIGRRFFPLYGLVIVLAVGMIMSYAKGDLNIDHLQFAWVQPVLTWPVFSIHAMLSLSLPIFIVTLISQNIPGLRVLRSEGYQAPSQHLIGWTGSITTLLAPLGCFGLNLSTITAAICSGKDAHPQPQQRYIAAIVAGGLYLIVGLFGLSMTALLFAFPPAFVMAMAGIALLSTFSNAITVALADSDTREASVLAFLVTASGLHLYGINAVIWGLIAGCVTAKWLAWPKRTS